MGLEAMSALKEIYYGIAATIAYPIAHCFFTYYVM